MRCEEARKGFDLKGFIDFARRKQNLSGYTHVPYPHDDIIRNMEEAEVELVIKKYNRELDEKRKQLVEIELLSSGDDESTEEEEPHQQATRISK